MRDDEDGQEYQTPRRGCLGGCFLVMAGVVLGLAGGLVGLYVVTTRADLANRLEGIPVYRLWKAEMSRLEPVRTPPPPAQRTAPAAAGERPGPAAEITGPDWTLRWHLTDAARTGTTFLAVEISARGKKPVRDVVLDITARTTEALVRERFCLVGSGTGAPLSRLAPGERRQVLIRPACLSLPFDPGSMTVTVSGAAVATGQQ